MKIWLNTVLLMLIFTGHCYAEPLNGFSSLPTDWRLKIWVYKFIDQQKTQLEAKKQHYTDTVGLDKIHLFKLYKGGSQHVLAFGPFENKKDATEFFEITQSSIFSDKYESQRVRTGDDLDIWFEIDQDGEIIETTKKVANAETKKNPEILIWGKKEVTNSPLSEVSEGTFADLDLQERKKVQQILKEELQMYEGKIDGDFGPASLRAIELFQAYIYEEETGELTVAQHRELLEFSSPERGEPDNERNEGEIAGHLDPNKPMDTDELEGLAENPLGSAVKVTTTEEEKLRQLVSKYEKDIRTLENKIKDYKKELVDAKKEAQSFYQTPITNLLEFQGKRPDGSLIDIPINFKESCLKLTANQTLEKNIRNIGFQTHCMMISEKYEIKTKDQLRFTKISNIKTRITLNLYPAFPLKISSIVALPNIGSFDIYSCGFNLLFTNRESGDKFELQMLFEEDGSAKANETIEEKLIEKGLDPENNNWKNLTVQIKKFQGETSNCVPLDNEPTPIQKKGSGGRFTISRDGSLHIKDVKLEAILDDLVVFVSKNIGVSDDGSGGPSFDLNYPFSNDLDLQNFYFKHALGALQKYSTHSDANFSNIKIYKAESHNYVKKSDISLPNKNTKIDSTTIFGNKSFDLKYMMPDASRIFKKQNVPNSAGILVIGSFGLETQDLCDHSLYEDINRSRAEAAVVILNFVPFENVSTLNYDFVHKAPATMKCPNNENIYLVYPNEAGKMAPEKVEEGFYNIITEGLRE